MTEKVKRPSDWFEILPATYAVPLGLSLAYFYLIEPTVTGHRWEFEPVRAVFKSVWFAAAGVFAVYCGLRLWKRAHICTDVAKETSQSAIQQHLQTYGIGYETQGIIAFTLVRACWTILTEERCQLFGFDMHYKCYLILRSIVEIFGLLGTIGIVCSFLGKCRFFVKLG